MSENDDKDNKTEEPTERRIEQAIERGDVPKSQEVATFFSLGAATLAMMIGAAIGAEGMVTSFGVFLGRMHQVPLEAQSMARVAQDAAFVMMQAVALPFAFALMAGIAGGLVVHRPLFTAEPLTPNLSRISPMSGFKRLFGREALVQFLKGLIKFALVGIVMYAVLMPERGTLDTLARLDPATMLTVSLKISLKLMGAVLAAYAIVAAADLLYQRFSWRERLKMSREELKQEFKETEGNPEIKARIRRLRQETLRRRMMAAVPKASVIITNPTHFAVALRYERGMNAPVLVAKGVDSLALKIREVGTEHDVPIVENPPLARALHANVSIDEEIPEEHFRAVAEVIGYVMRMRRRRQS